MSGNDKSTTRPAAAPHNRHAMASTPSGATQAARVSRDQRVYPQISSSSSSLARRHPTPSHTQALHSWSSETLNTKP